MERIRVVVQGAQGKMGREVVNAVLRSPEMELVGATEKKTEQESKPVPQQANRKVSKGGGHTIPAQMF